MRTVIVAVVGTVAVFLLARAARRMSVADRLRVAGAHPLPALLRAPLQRALDAAAVATTPEQVVEMWLLATVVAGLVGAGIAPATGVLGALAVLSGGPVVLRAAKHRGERLVAAAVPETLERIGSELRAGGTVATALAGVARSESVLGADIARVETRVRLGASLAAALRSWAYERRAFGVDVAAGALALSAALGGPAADALDGLASSLRDRQAVLAEARALSAQARYSAWVIGLAPIAYVISTAVVDVRSVHLLVGTNVGRVCMLLGVALELLGALWIRAILRAGEMA